ncbi:MAG TPA: GYD domain-containing protein [Ktedonobacteraceae bacterium]|nr:GYD domain-containing protein [Ktedonobacteraceae bacterium]
MYMVQFAYADQTWTALTQNPQDRTIPGRDSTEKLGGKLIQMCYCFGEYDGLG